MQRIERGSALCDAGWHPAAGWQPAKIHLQQAMEGALGPLRERAGETDCATFVVIHFRRARPEMAGWQPALRRADYRLEVSMFGRNAVRRPMAGRKAQIW